MEDASICMEGVEVEGYPHGPVAFYGIFDGHGGCTAAEFVKGHLVSHITSDPSFIKDPTTALVREEPTPAKPHFYISVTRSCRVIKVAAAAGNVGP